MLKFIGYSIGNGNSGIVTKEGAINWAQKILHSGQKAPDKVYIAEVMQVVERPEPTTVIKDFSPEEAPANVSTGRFASDYKNKVA
jgi:hypothetical protein